MEALLKAARARTGKVAAEAAKVATDTVSAAAKATTEAATAAVKTIQSAVPVIAPDGKIPSQTELELFFKGRSREPEFYTFDPKGNLIVRDGYVKGAKGEKKERGKLSVVSGVPGAIKRTYTIPPYIPVKAETREQLDNERIDAVRALEEQYEIALTALRELFSRYSSGDDTVTKMDILNANNEVAQLDEQRHAKMFAVREVYFKQRIPITHILYDQQFDKDKTFGDESVSFLRRSIYPLDKLYVESTQEIMPEAPVEAEQEGGGRSSKKAEKSNSEMKEFTKQLGEDLKVVLFGQPEENEYGFLSTFYPVEFVVNGVKYFTIEQVLASEKARLFLDDELRTRIMKTRAPRSMRTMASGIVMKPASQTGGMMQIQPHEWEGRIREDVLQKATYAKFKQHRELRNQLLATGGAVLGLCDTRERQDGTGLSLTDSQAVNPMSWKGGNLYGKILMQVRSRLREEERVDTDVVSGEHGTEEVHSSVISGGDYVEQLNSARKGAMINAARKRVGFA
jgi:ribA/ribD-fused uncharacterized protein